MFFQEPNLGFRKPDDVWGGFGALNFFGFIFSPKTSPRFPGNERNCGPSPSPPPHPAPMITPRCPRFIVPVRNGPPFSVADPSCAASFRNQHTYPGRRGESSVVGRHTEFPTDRSRRSGSRRSFCERGDFRVEQGPAVGPDCEPRRGACNDGTSWRFVDAGPNENRGLLGTPGGRVVLHKSPCPGPQGSGRGGIALKKN